jgi:hypothetical protein
MIHVKAILVGSLLLVSMLGCGVLLAKYPMIGFSIVGLGCSYCFGRAAMALIPNRS